MIPKTIHYCWFGKGRKSKLNKKRKLPSFQQIIKKLSILIPKLKWLQPPNKSNSTGTKKHGLISGVMCHQYQ